MFHLVVRFYELVKGGKLPVSPTLWSFKFLYIWCKFSSQKTKLLIRCFRLDIEETLKKDSSFSHSVNIKHYVLDVKPDDPETPGAPPE